MTARGQGVALHAQHGIAGLDAARPQERARRGQERGVGRDELVTLGEGDHLVHPLPPLSLRLDPQEQGVDAGARPSPGQVAGFEGLGRQGRLQLSLLY